MLRLLPDLFSPNIWVALSADGIAIAQQTRGLRKRILSQQYIKAVDTTATDWPALIQQLDVYLSGMNTKKNMPLNLVLSSDFVRYCLLPAQPIAMSSAEKNAYAKATMLEIYGAIANDWHIKCNPAAPDQNTILVAVDKALLAALKQLADKYQLKLDSVQPYLMSAFNLLASSLARTNGYFALLENQKILLLSLRHGICQQLHTIRFTEDWQAELNQALHRAWLLNENPDAIDKTLLIYAPAQKMTQKKVLSLWSVQPIGRENRAKLSPQCYMLEAVL